MSRVDEVNIGFGDDVSKMLYQAAKQSFNNRPGAVAELHSSFSGLRAIHPDYKPSGCYELLGSDGVGTKVEIAERLQDYSTVAHDLFAMVCDDAVIRGAEPIAINTVLDVNRLLGDDPLTKKAVRDIASGYVEAASLAKVVILNGELAELGERVGGYGAFHYNWCATLLSYAHKDRILAGDKVKAGDSLIGFGENGFRSNGLTDARSTLTKKFGENWHNRVVKSLSPLSFGKLVAEPSIIYTPCITELTGGYDISRKPLANISGIAHITGGGIPSKLGRMLEPSGCGASITRPQKLPPIMEFVHKLSGFSTEKAYRKWHMGSGMIVASQEPQVIIDRALKRGIKAQVIGVVTKDPHIKITHQDAGKKVKVLVFDK